MSITTERGGRPATGATIPLGVPADPAAAATATRLRSYLPQLALEWLATEPRRRHRQVEGTLVFADVSGFTKLSERLAKQGKVGAEELSDLIGRCFAHLLADAYANGGSLVKFGGDALLLLFTGAGNASRACRAAAGMRRALRQIGRITTAGGSVTLRMSVGIHSGPLEFYLVGDSHRELIITGPGASRVVQMEGTAQAGQIVLSPETAAMLPSSDVGAALGDGWLLRRTPAGLSEPRVESRVEPDARRLESCIPRAIRERLGTSSDDASHRRATVSFLHFDGLDALTAQHGPKVVADKLHRLVSGVQAAADRYAITFLGSDVDSDGGKIILVAGAPTSTENDEERMLLAVREIMDSDLPLALRVGINSGHVFAGDVGPSYRRTYTTMGDTVNLTARLMAKAAPGQVLVTDTVLTPSRTKFDVTPVEPFMVKGKARPVSASLLGTAHTDAVDETDDVDTPLIGRDAELREMTRLLAATHAGRGHLLEIVGEAGIGKSRLVQELRRRAQDLTVRSALCEEFEAKTPYFAFRHVLNALLEIPPTMPAREAGILLTSVATSRVPGVLPWLPLVAEVVGAEVPTTPEVGDLDPKFRPDRVATATIELLATLISRPTLVVVEDTHWMDEPSAQLLDRLSRAVPGLPLLVCTTRRDVRTGFRAQPGAHVSTLRPKPLDETVAASFVVAMTDDAPLAPHDVEALARRSGGNPLFLRELIAAARSAGSLDALPDSIEAVIVSRIDRLDAEDRALLRRLSVLGSTFEVRLANDVLGSDVAPGTALWRRLRGFLTADVPGVARFQHALIRDAAYSGLPYRVRQELHQQVGTAIERSAGADHTDHAGVLSLHFFNAGQYSKAWKYSRLAAERAQAIYANVEAAEFYTRAITAARRAPAVTGTDLAATQEARGDVYRRLGDYATATEAYATARRLVTSPVDEARLLLKTGRVREVAGRYADALRWLDRAAKALGDSGDNLTIAQRAQVAVAFAAVKYAQAKPHDVIARARQAVADATRSGDRDALAHAYYLLDAAHVALGDLSAATHSADALALYEELGDLWGQGQVLNNLGCYAYWRGEWDEALRLYERGRAARERIGDAVNASYGTLNIAEILSDQGRLDEAEPLLRQALRVWRAANDRVGVTNALAHLGRVLYRGGRYDEALEMLTEARELSITVGRYGDAVELGGRIAECHLLAGDASRALDIATDTIAQMRSVAGAAVHAPLLHRVRGQALAGIGRPAEAQRALEESLDAAQRRGADYEAALTLRALAVQAAAAGKRTGHLSRESAEILDRLGVVRVFEPNFVVEAVDTVSALVPAQGGAERPQPMEPTT